MALNKQTFKTRALTAIVFVLVMLLGLLWNQWSFLVLFSIIHFGCWWEYFRLIEKIHQPFFHPYVKIGFMTMGYGLMLWFCGSAYEISGFSFKDNFSLPVSAAGFTLLVIGIFQKTAVRLKSFGAAALGLLYISLSWGLILDLRKEFFIAETNILYQVSPDWHSIVVPCAIIFSIWVNDTMAYIVGSLIGKTPLTSISPKKTWEGTLGGMLLAILVAGIIAWQFYFDIEAIIIIAVIASIAGTLGDILESKLKRLANVKDSGSLMPGHGGFLDRFDSLLIAIPCTWLYVYLVIN